MRRIKPKWLLGMTTVLVAVLGCTGMALAAAPTGVEIVSPTAAAKVCVQSGNNIAVKFNYTSDPSVVSSTNVWIYVKNNDTVVGKLEGYPIPDAPGGGQQELPVTINAGTSDGLYDLYVTVTNHDGSDSDDEAGAVVVDNTDPVLDNQSPTGPINNDSPTLSVDFDDTGGSGYGSVVSFTITPNGGVTQNVAVTTQPNAGDETGTITADLAALADNRYTVDITVKDAAGNQASLQWTFDVDTTDPVLDNQSPTGWINNDSPTLSVDFGDTGGSGYGSVTAFTLTPASTGDPVDISGSITGEPVAGDETGTITADLAGLADDTYTVDITVVDAAGNQASLQWTFDVDTTNPVLDNQSATGPINNDSLTLSVGFDDTGGSGYGSVTAFTLTPASTGDPVDISESITGQPVAGGETGTITNDLAGLVPLADDTYTVDITVVDAAGNETTLSWEFKVDTTDAVLENQSPTGWINNDSPTLSVDFDDTGGSGYGSVVSFTLTPASTGDPVDISGSITDEPVAGDETATIKADLAGLADDTYTVDITVVDAAGNETTLSWEFKVDTANPVLANQSPTVWLGSGDGVTMSCDFADDAPTDSGYAPDVTQFSYHNADYSMHADVDPGALSEPGEGDLIGTISYTADLADGEWTVTVTAYDRAGNASNQLEWTFNVDSTPPVFGNFYPAEQTTIWDEWPEFRVDISDPEAPDGSEGCGIDESTISAELLDVAKLERVSWDGTTAIFRLPQGFDLADGQYEVTVSAADILGNSASEKWTLTIQHSYAPGMNAEPKFTPGTQNTVSWTDVENEESYVVEMSEDPSFDTVLDSRLLPAGTTSEMFEDLEDGRTYYYRVRAIAYGGRVSLWSNVVASTQDASGPSAPGTPSTPSPTTNRRPTWTWAAASDAGIGVDGYYVKLSTGERIPENAGGSVVYEGWVGNVTSWTYGADLADGTYALRVKAKDAFNQEGAWSEPGYVTIDTTAPGVPTNLTVSTPTNDTTPTWTWTASTHDVASYEVSLDGGAAVNIGNKTEYTPGGALSDGVHKLKVRALDALGNASDWAGPAEVLVDTVAPVITLINPESGARLNITTASTILADLFDSGSGIDQTKVRLRIDGGEWVAPTAIVGGTLYYVVNLPFEATDDKWHSLDIKAEDAVGNKASVSASFKVELYREGFGFGRLRFPEESD